jgi:predicted nucleic-acid-binding Zn-ribbon protein
MPYYRSGVCKCPKCGNHLFDGPSVAENNTTITCRACKHVTTIKEAEAFGKGKLANT